MRAAAGTDDISGADNASAAGSTLGVTFDAATDAPTFRLWAPTASGVQLNVYANVAAQSPVSVSMTEDPSSGVWSYTAPDASWTNMAYYTYSVRVFSRCPDADGAEGTPGGSVALLTAPE
jgi:pullulanase